MKETVERQLKVFQTEMNSVLTDSTNAQTNPHHIELVLHSIKEWEKVATTILTQDRLVTETENAIQDFERANWDIFRVQMRFEPYDGRLSFPVYRFADFTGQRH
jgi:putative heme iron utilization protein